MTFNEKRLEMLHADNRQFGTRPVKPYSMNWLNMWKHVIGNKCDEGLLLHAIRLNHYNKYIKSIDEKELS